MVTPDHISCMILFIIIQTWHETIMVTGYRFWPFDRQLQHKNDFMPEPFDLYSTQIDVDPFPYYTELRDNFPCYWSKNAQIWFLTRYDDVSAAAQDWQSYSSLSGNMVDEIPGRSGSSLGTTDPPRHDRLRALVQRAFAKKNLDHLIAPTVQIAERSIGKIKKNSSFDFVADFSSIVTVEILFHMLGLPKRDPVAIRKDVVLSISSDKETRGRNETHNQAFHRLTTFVAEEVENRRKTPSDDLITHLANAEIDGDRLSDREVILTTSMFVIAGVESLSSFMSMFALNLADEPVSRARIIYDRMLMPQAIEESLRYNTSAQRFKRVLTRDIELHGQTMKAGDNVALCYGAANRDQRKFPNPDIYDLDRNPQGHLGFGAGKHFCLGNSMAKLITQTAMNCLLTDIPEFSVKDRNFNWISSSNFRSPMLLPLSIL